MAPKTRSGGQQDPERVYTASAPKPRQARFPHRKTMIRGYGRKNARRTRTTSYDDEDASEETHSSPQQKTLTQMDFVGKPPMESGHGQDEHERPRKRRRKTEGDLPDSSSPSPSPSPSPKSKYRTQTLTQMSAFSTNELEIQIDDSEDEDLEVVNGGADSIAQDTAGQDDKHAQSPATAPTTPSLQRVRREIPSSQDSPITPMLARYSSPAPDRSPLKEKSTNIKPQQPKLSSPSKLSNTPRRSRSFVVEDSYATTVTKSPASSVENHSPAKPKTPQPKSVRFVTPGELQARQVLGERQPLADITEDMDNSEEGPESPSPVRQRGVSDREIADSDDEFDVWDESQETEQPTEQEEEEEDYGAVGEETQQLVDEMVSSSEKQRLALGSSSAVAHSDTSQDHPQSSAAQPASAGSSSFSEVPTVQLSSPPQVLNPHRAGRSPIRSQQKSQESPLSTDEADFAAPTQAETQHTTQGLESQRLPMDVIRAMAPQTDRSDIFISIHPNHVRDIAEGTKNHEFRNYKIPAMVSRMWIYVTAPVSQLQYMACISGAKEPGMVDDEAGIGNSDFNAGKMHSKFAYELFEVYELNNPVPLKEMKERAWVGGPPQKYNYVPPAVVGHLMANLRCSVFADEEEELEEVAGCETKLSEQAVDKKSATPQYTVSQEVTNQILSEATQHNSDPPLIDPSSPARSTSIRNINQGSSFDEPTSSAFKKPRLPPQTPFSRPADPTGSSAVRPSQATTESQMSSPNLSPVKRVRRPLHHSSSGTLTMLQDWEDENESRNFARIPSDSHQAASSSSSQLLTKSQMLPESLLGEEELAEDDLDIVYDSEG